MVKADLHNHIRTGSKIGSYLGKAMTKTRETLGENGVIGIINFGDLRYESFLENGKGRLDISSDGSYFYDKIEKVWGVKGQEVETDFGHLLILGVPSKIEIESRRSLDYILSSVRDFEGIIIADHPFYYQGCRRKLDLRIHEIDGFEVHNGEACFGLPFNFSPLNSF